MKNKLFVLFVMVAMFGFLPVSATLKVSDTTKEEYLRNRGYSATTVDMVNASMAAANGEAYSTKPARDQAKYKKFWPAYWFRKLVIYLDPAMESPDFMQHDIKMTPNIDDI